jgi:hypothetical protein
MNVPRLAILINAFLFTALNKFCLCLEGRSMKIWREHAVRVTGKALPAGHFMPEDVPDETLAELVAFLRAWSSKIVFS